MRWRRSKPTESPTRAARAIWRGWLRAGCAVAAAVCVASEAHAAAGVQYSLDRSSTLVSKDVGPERWAITYRIADGEAFGNVFYTDGRDPSFVSCTRKSIDGANGTFACYGAEACNASPCPAEQYTLIAEVSLPLSFFFPPFGGVDTDVDGDYDVSGVSRNSSNCDARLGAALPTALQQQGGCIFHASQTGTTVTVTSDCGVTYSGTTSPSGLIQAAAHSVSQEGACTTTADTEITVDASQDLSRVTFAIRLDFSSGCVFSGTSDVIPDCQAAGESLWIRIP